MSDIPEWAVKRANDLTSEAMKNGSWLPIGGHASAAFARYIAEHEEPPVDPLLLEAREICARVMEAHTGQYFRDQASVYREGRHDDEPEIADVMAALRARAETLP